MSFNKNKYLEILELAEKYHAKIVVVTKYVTLDEMIQAYDSKVRDFGENKAQDAEQKRKELPQNITNNVSWHFIGHLQSNKAKKVIRNYDLIHSVDSLKLAQNLNNLAEEKGIKQKILLQINVSEEESKFGFDKNNIEEVFLDLIQLKSLKIEGLMTIALNTTDEIKIRNIFRNLRELKSNLEKKFNVKMPELSMGMSQDYKIALEEGATIIRLGQILFK